MFHLRIKGYCETRPHRSYCFLSMFKLRCKRHYRNLATYSWCSTWREHVTITAPARRRHSVGGGGGGAPISYDRRRRRQQNVGGGGAAAAAHSSMAGRVMTRYQYQAHGFWHRDWGKFVTWRDDRLPYVPRLSDNTSWRAWHRYTHDMSSRASPQRRLNIDMSALLFP